MPGFSAAARDSSETGIVDRRTGRGRKAATKWGRRSHAGAESECRATAKDAEEPLKSLPGRAGKALCGAQVPRRKRVVGAPRPA